MNQYILINTDLFDAQMQTHLSNKRADKDGWFVQDEVSSLREVDLQDPPPTKYYVLKWSGAKPSSVPAQYSVNGNNPKSNKIFTQQEILDYLAANAV